jgi:glycosyltransferase involved in cell wall biosynthesis
MNILFIHQNFPGQFKYLAPELIRLGHSVTALTMQSNIKEDITTSEYKKINLIPYTVNKESTINIHPWLIDFETQIIRAEGVFKAVLELKKNNYKPDIVISHPGWGESLFIKEIWPDCKLGIYSEYYYQAKGADIGFDPEFKVEDPYEKCRIKLKNLNMDMHFEIADMAISPTIWQAKTFPIAYQKKISIIHDGIDTQINTANKNANITLNNKITLTNNDEIITFVNRNLEPQRGYHIFMRALPSILKENKKVKVLIIGNESVGYGAESSEGKSWKQIYTKEIQEKLNPQEWSRIYYLGHVPHNIFRTILQITTVHVYLTYPFVLSWSLLEAMSIGCAIIASDTAPVQEVIENNKTGVLVDFFNYQQLAKEIGALIKNTKKRNLIGKNARKLIIMNYDLRKICLPSQIEWVNQLGSFKL